MYWYNTNMIKTASTPSAVDKDRFLSERKSKHPDNIRLCSTCRKFVSGRNFWRHLKTCHCVEAVKVNPSVMFRKPHTDEEFDQNILKRFRESEAGSICATDEIIQQVGYRHYCLRRCHKSKMIEVKKNVMQEMRELARLFIQFQQTADQHGLPGSNMCTEDMFKRAHLPILREAISTLAGDKYGLKLNLNAMLLRAIKSLKGMYAERMEDEKCRELVNFSDAYKFRSHEMFAEARYKAIAVSMDKARRPSSLPEEEEMRTLKAHITSAMEKYTANGSLDSEDYVKLRSLVVCRLTLFNGRRGEEPARLLLSEWQDAQNDEWIRKHEVCVNIYTNFIIGIRS